MFMLTNEELSTLAAEIILQAIEDYVRIICWIRKETGRERSYIGLMTPYKIRAIAYDCYVRMQTIKGKSRKEAKRLKKLANNLYELYSIRDFFASAYFKRLWMSETTSGIMSIVNALANTVSSPITRSQIGGIPRDARFDAERRLFAAGSEKLAQGEELILREAFLAGKAAEEPDSWGQKATLSRKSDA